MENIRTFTTAQQARDYRHQYGTGGWIFAPDANVNPGPAVLFPPHITPSVIFRHQMTRGQTGTLIGA